MRTRREGPVLSRRERILKNIVGLAVRLIYRSVEVRGRPGETASGPQLTVSNHFGGFADALIQAYALDRVPRFIARDVIWRYPIAKQVIDYGDESELSNHLSQSSVAAKAEISNTLHRYKADHDAAGINDQPSAISAARSISERRRLASMLTICSSVTSVSAYAALTNAARSAR